MMGVVQLKRACRQVKSELASFLSRLKQLETLDYPTDDVHTRVIRDLKKEANMLEERVRELLGETEVFPDGVDLSNLTIVRIKLLEDLIPLMDWLRCSQTRMVPWSFIPSILRLAKGIVRTDKLVTYCENRYNYGITWSLSNSRAPYSYYVLALPRSHRKNVLLHTIIGHELFHPRCVEFIKKHNKEALDNIQEKCWHVYSGEDSGIFTEQEKQRIAHLANDVHLIWKRGIEELLCDMACVTLFGPAALLTMRAFSAASRQRDVPSERNNFYPPWQYRFEVVWKHSIKKDDLHRLYETFDLDEGNGEILNCFREEMNDFSEIATAPESGNSKGESVVFSNRHTKIAYNEIKRLLGDAARFVDESLPESLCRWNDSRALSQCLRLLTRLRHRIPPNETVEIQLDQGGTLGEFFPSAAELSAILVVGWMYESYWQRVDPQATKIMGYDIMLRLLLKACEDAEVRGHGA